MELTVSLLEGTYLEGSKHSKTHVYSTGNGTRDSPTRIHSQQMTIQEFWLKTPGGNEEKITLGNVAVDARAGHAIAMVIVQDDGGNADYIGYLNYSTGDIARFDDKSAARNFACNAAPCVLTILLAFIAGGIGWYSEGFIAGLIAFAAGMIASVIVRNIHAFFIQDDIKRLFNEATSGAVKQRTQKRDVLEAS
ncbi:hypothetical protein M2404_003643 [Rheinheimera pacifica]|uniref:hypothetical protein n=1 Tax=Rheinheimera pacifica TaxID=173990 RepID=UPI002168B81A|nr:hypothetical protein [Rheinheimera pacifica]MCS4309272.1 hypothetical protein [Rheinheimera pacifica]